MPTENEIKALRLIQTNASDWMPAAHMIVNMSVANLLKMGLIEYAAYRRSAYKLTSKGRAYIVV